MCCFNFVIIWFHLLNYLFQNIFIWLENKIERLAAMQHFRKINIILKGKKNAPLLLNMLAENIAGG